jgi:hypothetical protein
MLVIGTVLDELLQILKLSLPLLAYISSMLAAVAHVSNKLNVTYGNSWRLFCSVAFESHC